MSRLSRPHGRNGHTSTMTSAFTCAGPSPVDIALKAGPRGDGNWEGYDVVYRRISKGCESIAKIKHMHLGQDHVDSMADLGSGHEERMKWRVMWMIEYGYVDPNKD